MKKINFELSPEQYKELLRLVYAGNWILEEPDNIIMNDLVQNIFAKAGEAGYEKLIEYDDNLQMYMPSLELEDEMVDPIDKYEDNCFWEQLVYALSERDARRIHQKNFDEMDIEETIDLIQPISIKYLNEFEKNGLENVEVKGIF